VHKKEQSSLPIPSVDLHVCQLFIPSLLEHCFIKKLATEVQIVAIVYSVHFFVKEERCQTRIKVLSLPSKSIKRHSLECAFELLLYSFSVKECYQKGNQVW
jgi:hypothetical protein